MPSESKEGVVRREWRSAEKQNVEQSSEGGAGMLINAAGCLGAENLAGLRVSSRRKC